MSFLAAKFGLQLANNEDFFTEWVEDIPAVTDLEKQYLNRVKNNFLRLIKHPPILEDAVKMVVLSPILDLAGFYEEPFLITTEKSIELAVESEAEIVRGRIDVLVIQEQLWLLVIESKKASFSLLEAIPQALVYMLANPNTNSPIFGLVLNGEDFQFIKLTQSDKPLYALSDKFTLFRRDNELYKVLAILRKIGQIITN